MNLKWKARKGFSIIMMVMMVLQLLPFSLIAAIAEEISGGTEIPEYCTVVFENPDGSVLEELLVQKGTAVDPSLVPAGPVREMTAEERAQYGIFPNWSFVKWVSQEGVTLDNITADVVFKPEYELTGYMPIVPMAQPGNVDIFFKLDPTVIQDGLPDTDRGYLVAFDFMGDSYPNVPGYMPWAATAMASFLDKSGPAIQLYTNVANNHYYVDGWNPPWPPPASDLVGSHPNIEGQDNVGTGRSITFYAILVPQKEIRFIGNNLTVTYDGTSYTASGYTIELVGGGTLNCSVVLNSYLVTKPLTADATSTNVTTGIPNAFQYTAEELEAFLRNGGIKLMVGGEDVTRMYWVSEAVDGKLVINPKTMTISPITETVAYTGYFISGRFDTTGLASGHKISVTDATWPVRDAVGSSNKGGGIKTGSYPLVIEQGNVKILDAAGNDVTSNYIVNITDNPGTLKIIRGGPGGNPIPITIAANPAEANYTGSPITMTSDLYIIGGGVDGSFRVVGATASGTQTYVGAYNGAYGTANAGMNVAPGDIANIRIEKEIAPGVYIDVTDEYDFGNTVQTGLYTIYEAGHGGGSKIKLDIILPVFERVFTGITYFERADQPITTGANPDPSIIISVVGPGSLPEYYEIVLNAYENQREPGTYPWIWNGDFTLWALDGPGGQRIKDVTNNYIVDSWTNGALVIENSGTLRAIKIQANDVEREYSGVAVSTEVFVDGGYVVNAGDLFTGHFAEITSISKSEKAGHGKILPDLYPDEIIVTEVKIYAMDQGTKVDVTHLYDFDLDDPTKTFPGDLRIIQNTGSPTSPTLPAITVKANDDTKVFNGQQQTVSVGTTITGLLSNMRVTYPAPGHGAVMGTGTGYLPGKYPTTIVKTPNDFRVYHLDPNDGNKEVDVTDSYRRQNKITEQNGVLTITEPAAGARLPLTIPLEDVVRKYTGFVQPHAVADAKRDTTVNIWSTYKEPTGWTFTPTGVSTNADRYVPGTYPGWLLVNTFTFQVSYTDGLGSTYNNYDLTKLFNVTVTPATLIIQELTGSDRLPITVTAGDVLDQYYTGTARTFVDNQISVTVTGYPNVTAKPITVSRINVGTSATGTAYAPDKAYDTVITKNPNVLDNTATRAFTLMQDGQDVTKNYLPTYVKGKIILQRPNGTLPLTISSTLTTETYTGIQLNKTYTTGGAQGSVTGSPVPEGPNSSITLSVESTGLFPGLYDHTFTYNATAKNLVVMCDGIDTTNCYNLTSNGATPLTKNLNQMEIVPPATRYTIYIDPIGDTIDYDAQPHQHKEQDTRVTGNYVLDPTLSGVAIPTDVDWLIGACSAPGLVLPNTATNTANPVYYPVTKDNTVTANVYRTDTMASLNSCYQLVVREGKFIINPLTGANRIKVNFKADNQTGEWNGNKYVPFDLTGSTGVGSQYASTDPRDHDLSTGGFSYSLTAIGSAFKKGITVNAMRITDNSVQLFFNGSPVTQNYDIDYYEPGDIELVTRSTPFDITIKTDDVTVDYNGELFEVNQELGNGISVVTKPGDPVFDPTFVIYLVGSDGIEHPITATASGIAPNDPDGVPIDWDTNLTYVIRDADGVDITDNYNIDEDFGKLLINTLTGNKKIDIRFKPVDDLDRTIFTGDWVDVYTGIVVDPKIEESTAIKHFTGDVLAYFSGTVSGKALIPGINYTTNVQSHQIFVLDVNGVEKNVTENYTVNYDPGIFRIKDQAYTVSIGIEGADKTVPYTGDLITEHTQISTSNQYVTSPTETTGSGVTTGDYPLYIPAAVDLYIDDGINPPVLANNWFTIGNRKDGTLTIRPLADNEKIQITLKPTNATHKYTGNTITLDLEYGPYAGGDPEFAGTRINEVGGHVFTTYETLTANATGSGKAVRNDYDIIVYQSGTKAPMMMVGSGEDGLGPAEDMTDNYKFNYQKGTLEITALQLNDRIKLTLQAPAHEVAFVDEPYVDGDILLQQPGQSVIVVSGNLPEGMSPADVVFQAKGKLHAGTAADPWPQAIGLYPNEIVFVDGTIKIIVDGVDVTSSYDIMPQANDLNIKKLPLSLQLTVGDISKPFTGDVITVGKNEITITGEVTNGPHTTWKQNLFRVEFNDLTLRGDAIVPDTYDDWISFAIANNGFKIIDTRTNTDITDRFENVTVIPGKLTVTPLTGNNKLKLTVRPISGSLPYTGTTVTFTTPEFIVQSGGANVTLPGKIVTSATGSAILPGLHTNVVEFTSVKIEYPNQYGTIVDVTSNYTITKNKNNLTITDLEGNDRIPIIVTAGDTSVPFRPTGYYGANNPQTHVGVTAVRQGTNAAPAGNLDYTQTLAYGEGLVPGVTYPTKTYDLVITNGGMDVTKQYRVVRYVDGKLTITNVAPIGITITPDDKTVTYNGKTQVVPVTTGTTTFDNGDPMLPDTEIRVTFKAQGIGSVPMDYPINLLKKGTGFDAKIEQFDKVNNVWVDVTSLYAVSENPGTLTVAKGSIDINVTPEKQKELTYNGLNQGTYDTLPLTGVDGYIGLHDLPLDLKVELKGNVEHKNAGTYDIPIDPSDVVIYGKDNNGNWVDVTDNFNISTTPGEMKINPRVLKGYIKAPDALQPQYDYGDPVPVPPVDYTNYDFPDPDHGLAPGDKIPDVLDWSVYLKNRKGNSLTDAGVYEFWPEIIFGDPNYDTSEIELLPSKAFTIGKILLQVIPVDARRAQRGANPEFIVRPYNPSQLKYQDTLESIGLTGYKYTAVEGPSPAIGSWNPITFVSGIDELDNYFIEYLDNDAPGHGMFIFGQIWFYGNYPHGYNPMVISPIEYDSPADLVKLGNDRTHGFDRDDLRFEYWSTAPDKIELIEEGTPIGDNTLDVYARWTQLYQLIVHHQLSDGTPIAESQIFWIEEGAYHKFMPVEVEGFTAKIVRYTVDEVEYMVIPESSMVMPNTQVIAIIEYDAAPVVAGENDLLNVKGKGDTEEDDTWSLPTFGIYPEFIPLGNLGSNNMGICSE